MRELIEILALLLAVVVNLPVALFVLEVIPALWRRPEAEAPPGDWPSVVVVMPAHDEEAVIGATLSRIMPQLRARDRLVLVADNCSDGTADVARLLGAEVVERRDTTLRGKGYALDFGVRHAALDPREVLVLVDADCNVADHAIARIAAAAKTSGRPSQAYYRMDAPAGAGLNMRIAAFAWLVKNRVRPLGMHRMGWPCQLMGSGMALPWELVPRIELATGHIVEDMKLGVDLAVMGAAPLYCTAAEVSSEFPANAVGTQTQRTRWEHGHLSMIVQQGPGLIAQSLRARNFGLLVLALDFCIPPLALLVMLCGAAAVGTGVLWWLGGMSAPAVVAFVGLAALASSVLLAWWRYGREVIGLGDLLKVAGYVLWKIPMYLGFFRRRQVEWVRTQRDGSPSDKG